MRSAPRRDDHDLGARTGRPRHGAAGTAPAPSLTRPHWGRAPGSSPQRGEAGRGAERGERWSPQPSMRLAPHPDGMKKGSSWEGCALPNPPTGWGYGETRFPQNPAHGLRPPQPSHRVGFRGNPVSPEPCARAAPSPTLPPGGATGKPGFPRTLRGGGVGKPGFPTPRSESLFSR